MSGYSLVSVIILEYGYNDIYKYALVVHFLKKFLVVVHFEKRLGTPGLELTNEVLETLLFAFLVLNLDSCDSVTRRRQFSRLTFALLNADW